MIVGLFGGKGRDMKEVVLGWRKDSFRFRRFREMRELSRRVFVLISEYRS